MPPITVYNTAGKEVGKATLDPKVFNVPVKAGLVQQAVRTQMANSRVAISHTKTRAEVRGGGKKPWKQKGTGRARHGSTRSPIWKGGGVTFGPRKDRNYSLKINKKAKQQALRMILSDKARERRVIILDELSWPKISTKNFNQMLSRLPIKKTVLLVMPKTDTNVIKSSRNLPFVKVIRADSLNVVDTLSYEYLLCLKDSLAAISKIYTK